MRSTLPASTGRGPCQSPADLVGGTPVLWIADGPAGFWAKLEGTNPGGIKDRAALHAVHRARLRGELAPGAPIVESTSGTFGLALAIAGMTYGHPVTVVTDPGLESMMAAMLAAHGVEVITVDRPHETGGWQQARRDTVARVLAERPGSWCPDQYTNPDVVDGYRGLGEELLTQLGRVDVLVCSVGTGGHSAGIHETVHHRCPSVRMVGVDTIGSAIFGQPARSRLMRGLGSSIHPRNVRHAAFSEVHWVAPAEAVWSARRLARDRYATGGWSVGAVALVAGWLARTSPAGTRVAAIFPDGPARYAGTVFDDDYCRRHGLLDTPPPTEPRTIAHPGAVEARTWTRCAAGLDPSGGPR